MELIGGVVVDGALRRDAVMRPLLGATEMLLAELASSALSQPERVTRFLATTVAEIGGRPIDRAAAAALSVGDRQHLVRRIGAAMGRDLVWLNGTCSACSALFDIPIRQSELPVKPAGPAYPEAAVELGGEPVRLRAPTGADQAAVADMEPEAAVAALLRRLAPATAERGLDAAEQAALEEAVEQMAPEVALEALARCPDCGAENLVAVDPYLTLQLGVSEIYDDVHVLARSYHWCEADILALPRDRRKRYLQLIDRERGMMSHDAPPLGM